jgi:GDPmannose 4,6-dehydratase
MKKALITGITGQDGSYLAELLLEKGYEVHGLIRRASTFNTDRIDHLYVDPHEKGVHLLLHYGDLSDSGQLTNLIYNIQPDEVYHLAAQSHVRVSFDVPEYTGDITGMGTTRLLEAVRRSGIKTKYYQASSSEMFGDALPPQNENTPFQPRSPYAAAKLYSYWMAKNYREAYGLFACNGILFNHESFRRGETFITRKITRGLANILAGKQHKIFLGNLEAKRDWGYAPEYVQAMWLMLQQDTPDDYVIGTGESHSVREFIEFAFNYVGIEIQWKGDGVNEKGIIQSISTSSLHPSSPPSLRGASAASDEAISPAANPLSVGDILIEIDPRYFRPTEVGFLQADAAKAINKLGWKPKVTFRELVKIMIDCDMESMGLEPPREGKEIHERNDIAWTSNKMGRR